MHHKIVELLEQFGIAVGWEELNNTEELKEYIVFSIYNNKDSNITTEGNLTETHYITVNYWYKDLNNINKYKKIKSLLKKNGFIFESSKDLLSDGVHGKSMDFIYVEEI